jgi:hypothetical protein
MVASTVVKRPAASNDRPVAAWCEMATGSTSVTGPVKSATVPHTVRVPRNSSSRTMSSVMSLWSLGEP